MERIEENILKVFPTISHITDYWKKIIQQIYEMYHLPTADCYTAEYTMINYDLKYYFIK